MNFTRGLEALQSKTFLLSFFALLFLILPGVAIIFLFDESLFRSLDWVKLLLLSASITMPFALLNGFMEMERSELDNNQPIFFLNLVGGTIIAGLELYLVMSVTYLFELPIQSAFLFIFALLILQMLMLVVKKLSKNKQKQM